MSTTIADMLVRIGADISELDKSLESAEKSFKRLGDKLSDIGMKLSLAVTAPLAGIGIAATKMAMDAVESENLFEVSMGGMADAARKWSEDLRDQLGLNAYEVRKNVSTFNQMLTAMGMGKDVSFDMAKGLTQLAYDMASFFNLKPDEAFLKLQAGITGEIEPLKRLGIVVNETTIQIYAYTHGIAEQGSELTEQQKIFARYGAIMEQTKNAQGDLARTMDSPTNRLRIMGEQVKNVAIDFGMTLLPILQDFINNVAKPLLEALKGAVEWFKSLSPEVQQTIITFAGVIAVIGPVAVLIGTLVTALGSMLNPVGLVVVAIGGLVTAGILLYQNWDKVVSYAELAWDEVKLTVLSAIEIMLEAMDHFTGWIPGWGDKIRGAEKYVEDLRKGVEKHMGELQKPMEKTDKTIDETGKRFNALSNAGKDASRNIELDTSKMGVKVKKVMDDLDRELKANAVLASSLGNEYKESSKDADAYQKAIKALIDAGVDPASAQILNLTNKLRYLQPEVSGSREAIDELNMLLDLAFQKELTESSEAVAELNRLISDIWNSADPAVKIMDDLSQKLEINQKMSLALGSEFDSIRAKTDLIRGAIEDLVKQGVDPASEQIQNLKDQLRDLKIEGAFHVQEFSDFAIDEFIKIKKAIEDNLSSALADALMGKDVDWQNLWDTTLKMILKDIIGYLITIGIAATGVKQAIASMLGIDLGTAAVSGIGAEAAAAAAAAAAAGGAAAGGAEAAAGAAGGAAAGGFSLWPIAAVAALVYGIEQSGAIETIQKGLDEFINGFLKDPVGWLDEKWNLSEFERRSGIPGLDANMNSLSDIVKGVEDTVKKFMDDVFRIKLAKGGIVTGPTRALIGEAGPEAVIPLDRLDDVMSGGSQTIIIELDGRTIAKKTVQHMPSVLRLQGVPV